MSKRKNKCPHCKGGGFAGIEYTFRANTFASAKVVVCGSCAGTGTLTTKRGRKP